MKSKEKRKEKIGNLFLKEINGFMLNCDWLMCHFSSYWGRDVPAIRDIIYCVFMTWKQGTRPLCSLQQESWKTFLIKSKTRKRNLFNAMVKEAKVKDFAVLFLALSWSHQGNHKKLSSNISKSTLINFCLNIFFTYIVSLSGISFHN